MPESYIQCQTLKWDFHFHHFTKHIFRQDTLHLFKPHHLLSSGCSVERQRAAPPRMFSRVAFTNLILNNMVECVKSLPSFHGIIAPHKPLCEHPIWHSPFPHAPQNTSIFGLVERQPHKIRAFGDQLPLLEGRESGHSNAFCIITRPLCSLRWWPCIFGHRSSTGNWARWWTHREVWGRTGCCSMEE